MLLEARAAWAGVTVKAVATAMGIEVRSGRVSAESDLDFRGTLASRRTRPVGFADIRPTFELDTDAPRYQLDSLLKLAERYCVVLRTLQRPPTVAAKFVRERDVSARAWRWRRLRPAARREIPARAARLFSVRP